MKKLAVLALLLANALPLLAAEPVALYQQHCAAGHLISSEIERLADMSRQSYDAASQSAQRAGHLRQLAVMDGSQCDLRPDRRGSGARASYRALHGPAIESPASPPHLGVIRPPRRFRAVAGESLNLRGL